MPIPVLFQKGLKVGAVLSLKNISKKFHGQEVLKTVDFSLQAGEIHGIVGENGAGKSTLLSILIGSFHVRSSGGYSGEVYFGGQRVEIKAGTQAAKLGIGMVHQEFALLPDLNVAENIQLGREKVIPWTEKILGPNLACIDQRANYAEAKKVLDRLGLPLDPGLKVIDLSVNLRQFVEMAREIGKEHLGVLILDEPTAALCSDDARRLLDVARQVARAGTGVVFVSHRLEEVMAICDKITVLRDGQIAAVYTKPNFDRERIVRDMVGRTVVETRRRSREASNKVVMSFRNFHVDMPGESLRDFNLDLYQGEIIGLTGLAGHGKLALGNGAMGMYPAGGQVYVEGRAVNLGDNRAVVSAGVCFLPEDRRQAGLLLTKSVMENIAFTALQQKNRFLHPFPLKALGLMDRRAARSYSERCIKDLDIKCHSCSQKVYQLSGGNQQKVCLARALATEPKILIIAEPTRGVDIGAKEKILEALTESNETLGTTVLLISSELAELRRVCDRIGVIHDGYLNGILSPNAEDGQFARLMSDKS